MAGHSRLPMAGLAKLNDDQEDPDFLEKYLMPPDALPEEPETADGMLVMGMAQGDEEVLFKVPRLSERAPAARGYAYAKLVIGKYKDFDMALSVRRIANGAFVPRVTAGRYIVGGERRLPVNEDLCPDERLIGMQIWLDTRRDTGLNGEECLKYYQNWLVRVERSFFPEHPIYKNTRDRSQAIGGVQENSVLAETTRTTRELTKRTWTRRRVEGEDEKELIQRYRLSSVAAFWTSYEEDGKENLDLDDEKVCEMIGQGFLEFKQSGEGTDPPPMSVLKAARDEYRKFQAAAGSVENTVVFRTWNLQTTTGTRKPPTVEWFPSLYEVDEANRKKREQKEELQRQGDGQWFRGWLLKNGMTEDQLRKIDEIAHNLKDVDI
ncbi:hypothetical protein KC342_g5351 [Hortaea werneckii]|nr:hypothetical protein KC342_g5351 [Hortaea werneckii]